MRNVLIALIAGAVCACPVIAQATRPADSDKPLIQIALLLDTSNSMDGLINQAKAQLWKIVNEFIPAKRDGKRPEFQVALYEYGNDGLNAEGGYIRQVLPLTTDLDKVSEELFALRTNGGQEYCGHVIQKATQFLAWSSSNNDFKAIFIAGNEPFTQGTVDYHKACKEAITRGIIVNTIFCGPLAVGISTNWKDGALLADGKYMNIDQNCTIVHIDAPQDAEIVRLSAELNRTYISYGSFGRLYQARQTAQDANAVGISKGSSVQRAVTKSSHNYMNANWDLVDALKEGKLKLAELKDEDLPEEVRKLNREQRQAYVETKAAERSRIQQRIQQLNKERAQYVAKQMNITTTRPADSLDEVVMQCIREQIAAKHFKCE